MAITQAKPLNGFYRRNQRSNNRTEVRRNTNLPPLEAFDGAPAELLAMLTEWTTLAEQERKHAREARIATDAVGAGEVAHRQAVREALAAGQDAAKVKPSTAVEKHRKAAEEHQGHAQAAAQARERLGFDLGPAIESAIPALMPTVETSIDESRDRLEKVLDRVADEFRLWNRAFDLRLWFSRTAINGGSVPNFDPASPLPAEVGAALGVLRNYSNSLDRLRSDEAEVLGFRQANQ